jgi:hypothetical protein
MSAAPDRAFESWLENLKPGDPVWHTDGRKGIAVQINDDDMLIEVPGDLCYDTWPIEDIMPPEDTPFHKWAAAQGNEDIPAWWEVK